MDKLAYFLWTAVDHYPKFNIEDQPIQMASVGENSMYHKKCLQQIRRFVNWWEESQKTMKGTIEKNELRLIKGKLF